MITKVCPKCGESTYVDIPKANYEEWQFGVSLQEAWPDGSDTEREVLISGLCPNCQSEVFKNEL